jgi:murein endopeptidase
VRFAILMLLLALVLPAVLLAAPRDDDDAAGPPAARTMPAPRNGDIGDAGTAPLPRNDGVDRARPPARAAGVPWHGRLIHGRELPAHGPGYLTWDAIRKRVPNRGWRRWGTGRLVGTVRRVLAAYARRHPRTPPVLVGDLSRPKGGDFGRRYGGIGHASHQNGRDVDVYYPRLDRRLLAPRRPDQVDRAAAQELVDAFVRAGAQVVFVGPSLDLHGPPKIVQPLVNHDDHLHVRLPR